jgi:hypothetical protein
MAKSVQWDEPIEALLKEDRKFSAAEGVRQTRARSGPRPVEEGAGVEAPVREVFVGGKLNVAHNCLDRHVTGLRRTKAALTWEGEPGDTRTLTCWDL